MVEYISLVMLHYMILHGNNCSKVQHTSYAEHPTLHNLDNYEVRRLGLGTFA
jgi:hypothetical protein